MTVDFEFLLILLTLKRKKKPTRKVYKYNKTNWVNMNKDIIKITENITSQYETAARVYVLLAPLIGYRTVCQKGVIVVLVDHQPMGAFSFLFLVCENKIMEFIELQCTINENLE
jgi:hypothetical protein